MLNDNLPINGATVSRPPVCVEDVSLQIIIASGGGWFYRVSGIDLEQTDGHERRPVLRISSALKTMRVSANLAFPLQGTYTLRTIGRSSTSLEYLNQHRFASACFAYHAYTITSPLCCS